MIRQHQFSKVELVSITTPEQTSRSRRMRLAPRSLKRLGLHYRTVLLCTGDMGFSQKPTTSRSGCRGKTPTVRFRAAPCGDFQAGA